ncbi:unnamed protein product [Urochloa decumbens]|uniref:Chalcone/stilbene synthase N-terminal domain-containing protein n=1 Tax=Urochloa decumbens TaxID=240449 RepID=A0ABC9AVU4_9POAL
MAPIVLEENRTAAVLAIGTANPANCVLQDEFPDWYFRITRSDHLATLKAKMKRICEKSGVRKRHIHHIEEMIGTHPEFLDRALPSLGARLRITDDAVPQLAAAAAAKAIADWGRPAADITHLVFSTNSGAGAPGPDLRLAALLGLRPTVQRTVLHLHGCSAGTTALRVAKDLAENNGGGARVLVVSADNTSVVAFRAPDEAHLDTLVVTSIFGDGAGAVIVGAGPMVAAVERPIFHMVAAAQETLPGMEHAVVMSVGESGLESLTTTCAPSSQPLCAAASSGAWPMRWRHWALPEVAAGTTSSGRRTPAAARSWIVMRRRSGCSRRSWRRAGMCWVSTATCLARRSSLFSTNCGGAGKVVTWTTSGASCWGLGRGSRSRRWC